MKEHFKRVYLTPKVELIEARVEKGFAGSGTADPQTSRANEALTASGNSYGGDDFD